MKNWTAVRTFGLLRRRQDKEGLALHASPSTGRKGEDKKRVKNASSIMKLCFIPDLTRYCNMRENEPCSCTHRLARNKPLSDETAK